MDWKIGQEVVCIDANDADTVSHRHSGLKEGTVYTILNFKKGCCSIVIDVGLKGLSNKMRCSICNRIYSETDSTWWFKESRFVPLEYNQQAIEELISITKTEKIH